MIKLYSPENDVELAILKSLFDSEEIHYYVLNDHFGTLKIGPKIDLFNAKIIYVEDKDYDFAKSILIDYLQNTQNGEEPFVSQHTIPDKIRMAIEALVFAWFVPGSRSARKKIDE